MQNLILGGVQRGTFKIQECLVRPKSIFDLFGQKWPACMVTVNASFLQSFLVFSVQNGYQPQPNPVFNSIIKKKSLSNPI